MKKNYSAPQMRLRPGLLATLMVSGSQSPFADGKERRAFDGDDGEQAGASTGMGITKSLW